MINGMIQRKLPNVALPSKLALAVAAMLTTAQGQTFKVLYAFGGVDGSNAQGKLLLYKGSLFGTTYAGGWASDGTVFQLHLSTNRETLLYSFSNVPSDGVRPEAGLIVDSAGNLYGATPIGGGFDLGTVFQISSSGGFTLLHSFSGPDGDTPLGALVRDSQGNLYGTTSAGGENKFGTVLNNGTVYKLDTSGNLSTLHYFRGQPDGEFPQAGLVLEAGYLFGTTQSGGASNRGTVFATNASTGKTTVLYSFTGAADGGGPHSALIGDGNGNLYGTTPGGGSGYGVVFKLNISTLQETVLYTFSSAFDGSVSGDLVRDPAGNLYGTAEFGGTGAGTVFELDTTGTLITLHSFDGKDGEGPSGGLVFDSKGNLYGSTQFNGRLDNGTIFEITP
jgi:uncharacterized repeat protein (TIGR03803 family)